MPVTMDWTNWLILTIARMERKPACFLIEVEKIKRTGGTGNQGTTFKKGNTPCARAQAGYKQLMTCFGIGQ